jgi:hypothetical protein
MRNRWVFRSLALAISAVAILGVARPLANAWEKYQRAQWQKKMLDAYYQMKLQRDDELPPLVLPQNERADDTEEDDPRIRRLYTLAYYGNQATPDVSEQRFLAAQRESARWSSMLTNRRPSSGAQPYAAVAGQSWVNLGPTDARIQKNGSVYQGIDSGRAATIRIDPRDKDVVYLATAWGGVWKTYNFTATQPSWSPITDTIGALAVGAFDLDPNNPDTLYLGLGDALDSSVAGGAVYKSTDGGGSWTLLTARLSGAYPASAGSRTENAVAIRDIAVDRSDPNKLLVATDIGLFRTVDGGATFTLASLPNDMAGTVTLESAPWTIAYLGAAGGKSAWLVTGVDACASGQAPLGFGLDEPTGATTPTYSIACAGGTLGDIWRSTDSGATWTSLRATGKLPTATALGEDFARMAVAVGSTANGPDATVAYVQVANIDDLPANSKQLAVFKSTDGGKTFPALPTAKTNSPVSNPTNSGDCTDMNVAHGQAWYNLAIAVDPTDANHVLLGGNFCGVRSTDGGTTWDNVSHWLTTGETLPYVHADWHGVTIASVGGTVTAFAGTDGGFFASSDLFSAAAGASTWNHTDNRGIATHLFYGISSGDPTAGDESVVFGGLQDNGTRFRDLDPTLGKPTTFNQVIGGDGIGTALVRGPTGVGNVYWSSLPSKRELCKTDPITTCSQGTGWAASTLALANGTTDPDPFIMRYSVVDGDTAGGMLTSTTYHVFKIFYNGTTLSSARLTAAAPAGKPGPLNGVVRNVVASPYAHTNCAGGVACRLYGVALSGGKFAVLTDKGTPTAPAITPTIATAQLGIGAAANQVMRSTTSIAFPSSAAHFKAGATDGSVYIAGSTAPRVDDGITVVPDTIGRIFLTTDGGATYTAFHGNGTSDLPNVPVQVIVFDPSDTTDKTIFVGNDLGVYQTTDMGVTWHRYGVGFPLVRVTEIRIAKNSGLMRVGTYGRGLWEIYPNANAAPGVRGDGDWDRNLAIDFLDLGAMASRLGDTPATAAQPYYDWHLDVTGTVNAIAEDDLTALVGKFGSHP